jgi:hypothetical protein
MFHRRKIAVFDAEIKKTIEQCSKGWQSHDEMGVSCLCIYDYFNDRYRVFDDSNIQEALEILYSYKLVVGFNTVGFDWKLIRATYPDQCKTLHRASIDYDILREIWCAIGVDPDHFQPHSHGGYKLDDVAFETIRMKKSGHGELAPKLYQEGRMAELIDYCIEDVRIEKSLFEHVMRTGYVVRKGKPIHLKKLL